jgi:hypothetical protein
MGPEPFTDSEGAEHYILWGRYEPTARARQFIKEGEYRYTSPCFGIGIDKATGKPQGVTLSTVALTNRPVILQMPRIVMSDGGAGAGNRKLEATMAGITGFGGKSWADVQFAEMVRARMEATGENQAFAEQNVIQTSAGKTLWEEARRLCSEGSGIKSSKTGGQKAGALMAEGTGLNVKCHAAERLSGMIHARMAETGENAQEAEINVIRTDDGRDLWELAREIALRE